MRAALRGGFFVGFSRRKRPVKRPLRISTNTASHGSEIRISVPTEQMRILRTSRRKSCRVPSPEAKFSRNVRYASLYAFNDGFYFVSAVLFLRLSPLRVSYPFTEIRKTRALSDARAHDSDLSYSPKVVSSRVLDVLQKFLTDSIALSAAALVL